MLEYKKDENMSVWAALAGVYKLFERKVSQGLCSKGLRA